MFLGPITAKKSKTAIQIEKISVRIENTLFFNKKDFRRIDITLFLSFIIFKLSQIH
jgi:hypothetical protein